MGGLETWGARKSAGLSPAPCLRFWETSNCNGRNLRIGGSKRTHRNGSGCKIAAAVAVAAVVSHSLNLGEAPPSFQL